MLSSCRSRLASVSLALFRLFSTKTMDSIANVEIDRGKFKYILVKLMDGANNQHKFIVRGYQWAGYHGDILDSLEPQFEAAKLGFECVGGGRIIHRPEEKSIKVFGYSQGFGKADHAVTCQLLKKQFPDYTSIEWSDEGY